MSLRAAYQAVRGSGGSLRSGINKAFPNLMGSLEGQGRGMGRKALGWAGGRGVFKHRSGFRPIQFAGESTIGAARLGGAAAAADFMNPWGFGWGD